MIDQDMAPTKDRILAGLIDGACTIPLSLLHFIPLVGMFAGLVIVAFWLLRDYYDLSPGKRLLGLKVVAEGTLQSPGEQAIWRNGPMAAANLVTLIPFVGWILTPIPLAVALVELALLLARGYRLGDMLARTRVVKPLNSL
jgi:uncharacterized RDD family membrane protein YckC